MQDNGLRIYCVMSKEALALMGGNRGKMTAQSGHAFLHAFWDAEIRFPASAQEYRHFQTRKITVTVETTAELLELYELYKDKCGVSLVKDAGFTVFKEPTVTCLGIGPIEPDAREDILKNLRPLL
jgi:peptidyl-tRNA hydrolase